MKLSLPANISKLRKEHAMTQEQLAEALGVTFASVSKWERGVATPELNLIAEMADLFGVSFDAIEKAERTISEKNSELMRLLVSRYRTEVLLRLKKEYTNYNVKRIMMKLSLKQRKH